MKIRPFQPDDAEACFRLRSNAFIQKFHGELTPEEIAGFHPDGPEKSVFHC
jgi:hypothetical protein